MGCNTTQNEVGGKTLILKACTAVTGITTALTGADILKVAHGLKVGDIVVFTGGLGSITGLTLGQNYYVKTITDADNFQISATKAGAAIVVADAEVAVEADFFTTIGGIRSKSLSMSADGIDITNADSDEWKTMLDAAGVRSMSLSGSGVYNNQTLFQSMYTKFLSNSLTCLMLIESGTARIYSGCWKLTSLEISGDYDGEGNFSISAESSGQISTVLL